MKIALTGASGHMGIATLREFLLIPEVEEVRCLVLPKDKREKLIKKLARKYKGRVAIIHGDISNLPDLEKTCEGVSYLFNLAAVIPPGSDKDPEKSRLANEVGALNAIKVCENNPDIKLIDITSVALYGHRTYVRPFERVGDPLMPSVFDAYAAHKLRGEFAILESDIKNFVIIRQTAMIYYEMLMANQNDGLMFHTAFNDPLEWSTAEDSGRLMANIVKEDLLGHLNRDNFWNKIFNLGDKEENRVSGFDTIQAGFSLMGGGVKAFYGPHYNVTRNFHGGFYLDGDELDKLFHYQHDNFEEYWKKIGKKYHLGMAKIVPAKFIKKFAIDNCLKDNNAPEYWYKHNDIARLTAFFGSKEDYENQPKDWKDFNLIDFKPIRSNSNYVQIDYGFDINKSDKDVTIEDLKNVAKMHAGKLISDKFTKGDVYTKLEWENQDGERFIARPYSVIRGGHWMNPLYKDMVWDFDRLSKKDKLYAQYWYDSHKEDEDHCYYFNDKYEALMK